MRRNLLKMGILEGPNLGDIAQYSRNFRLRRQQFQGAYGAPRHKRCTGACGGSNGSTDDGEREPPRLRGSVDFGATTLAAERGRVAAARAGRGAGPPSCSRKAARGGAAMLGAELRA